MSYQQVFMYATPLSHLVTRPHSPPRTVSVMPTRLSYKPIYSHFPDYATYMYISNCADRLVLKYGMRPINFTVGTLCEVYVVKHHYVEIQIAIKRAQHCLALTVTIIYSTTDMYNNELDGLVFHEIETVYTNIQSDLTNDTELQINPVW